MGVARDWGEEEMSINCLMETKFYSGVMKTFWNQVEVVVTQLLWIVDSKMLISYYADFTSIKK